GVLSYPLFLTALMVLAAGITVLQVAANPYVAVLGRPETASSRLNLTQAFNSLGTAVFGRNREHCCAVGVAGRGHQVVCLLFCNRSGVASCIVRGFQIAEDR